MTERGLRLMTPKNKLLHNKLLHSAQITIQFNPLGDSLEIENHEIPTVNSMLLNLNYIYFTYFHLI